MKLLGIVPARSKSERLPNKNFKKFFGKPMISWVLEEMQKSEVFERIIVSTDKRIEWMNPNHEVIKQHVRSSNVAQYDKNVDDVCLEVIQKEKGYGREYDYLCVIYPTAYAITQKDILEGLQKHITEGLDFSYSYGTLNFDNEDIDNGGYYFARMGAYMDGKVLVPQDIIGEKVGLRVDQVDINTIEDFIQAKIHALTLGGRYK